MFEWTVSDDQKTSNFYLIAATIGVALLIWGIFIGLYVLAVVVLLGIGLYVFIKNNSSDTTHIHLDEYGIQIDDRFFDYTSLDGYRLRYDDEVPVQIRLFIKVNNPLFRTRDIDLPHDLPAREIDLFLSDRLDKYSDEKRGVFERWFQI